MPKTGKSILNRMLSDSDDHKKSNKDVNASLNALFDAVLDGLIIIDKKGNIQLFNSAAQNMFLYSNQEVLDKNIKLLMPMLYNDKSDKYLPPYQNSCDTKVISEGRKVTGKKSNGDEFPIFISVGEVKGSSHVQFVCIIRNISEQERDRIEAQESRERLSHATRLSSMGELAAGIAHELNQPLSAISSYSQASKRLLLTRTQINEEKIATTLDKICDQAISASEVINRLRSFVNKRVSNRQSVDLNELILETVNLAKVDTRILDFEIIVELNLETQPKLLADPLQIQQVLLSLIRNGIDAMEHVKGAPLRIQCEWLTDGLVEVSVFDCGHGMDEEINNGIFTPFITNKESGMGMGLPISQTIINAHGGRIYYVAGQPTGCIFSFSLPASIIKKK